MSADYGSPSIDDMGELPSGELKRLRDCTEDELQAVETMRVEQLVTQQRIAAMQARIERAGVVLPEGLAGRLRASRDELWTRAAQRAVLTEMEQFLDACRAAGVLDEMEGE